MKPRPMSDPDIVTQVYGFAPLFTLQPNESSRRKQFGIWRDILIFNKIFLISQGTAIFKNPKINRMCVSISIFSYRSQVNLTLMPYLNCVTS